MVVVATTTMELWAEHVKSARVSRIEGESVQNTDKGPGIMNITVLDQVP